MPQFAAEPLPFDAPAPRPPVTQRPSVPLVDDVDWAAVAEGLDHAGVATTPPLLDADQCAAVTSWFDRADMFRSTVVMSRHAFGEGSYRYFADPLPTIVRELREALYEPLAFLANRWATRLGDRTWPAHLSELLTLCAEHDQHRVTPLLLRYGPGGYNTLHQDIYGDIAFPLQVAIMLSRPDVDFTGGESVFVENRPRQQSRAVVVRPTQGQGIVFPVRHRPLPGAHGDRRVSFRHGVSEVHAGQRLVLGIIFHNAH